MLKKILFLDRDGTLIDEPMDKQVDCISKLRLKNNVIPALLLLKDAGYSFVLVTNQDGLGTKSFEKNLFEASQAMMINIFNSQGISFDDICICPHTQDDACECRKPRLGLVMNYLRSDKIDFARSYVIGDRETDLQLAKNMGITGILYKIECDWLEIARQILDKPRFAEIQRSTKETNVSVAVNLDQCKKINIATGVGFYDHMLEQLAKHGDFNLDINVTGDLDVDEHHTVEDTALALGSALRTALGDKLGINRYGFLLPMDEASAEVALDLSGRPYFVFEGSFNREKVGDLPTELVSHFFRSLSESLGAAIHIKVKGENAHHMVESIFKSFGRALKQAIYKQGNELPTTKGVL
ncbi:MAG: bifunctional histidinol-phosphatase/imidazoleglycerol-phosphate dehydratase HisB [Gammaproteobacteria bacterium]|nr:bifunctional histidinol-phosphatase/imidazoleglycerol-phosphate dehydratase HisB [Gammaproteobacteria bacterium]